MIILEKMKILEKKYNFEKKVQFWKKKYNFGKKIWTP